MANVTYTVKRGDTLTGIAKVYDTTVAKLVELNNIKDPDYIIVGQVLIISGTASTTKKNNTKKARVDVFGLQSNTDRTVYAMWTWSKDNTENYQVKWWYATGDKKNGKLIWFVGSDSTVTDNQATYTAPENATQVKFQVKPISKKKTVNNRETSYWTASWSTAKTYNFDNNPPTKPAVPTVTIEDYKLTATLDNLDVNASYIQFQVVKDNADTFSSGKAKISTSHAEYSCTVAAGGQYKVRCRSYRDNMYSDWTEYSNNMTTIPAAVSSITKCEAKTETSVYLEWEAATGATTYDIEYATKQEYFDGSNQTSKTTGIEYTQYTMGGLTSGEEYFFRVRAVNDKGNSAWSEIKSTIIGTDPAAPTTWSSTTTVITGETLILYWVHNSEDGSSQTYAELELTINGVSETHTIENSTTEDEKDKTSSYSIDTSKYAEGSTIKWRVRTAGITKVYGDWSIQRTVDIYAPLTLQLVVTDSTGSEVETLESFPLYISATSWPTTQTPIGYHLVVTANESYEAVDQIGNTSVVSSGGQVYSKYFDTSEQLLVELSANSLDLENNISYTVTCTVSANSGLTAESSVEFTVAWTDEEYEPNAEISIDEEVVAAYIRPYCEDEDGNLIEDITLSVYRREFDGSFVEIASGISNTSNTYVTDPHPALDYARYRIVAITNSTGAVSYCDLAGYPVGEKAIIIQWDEQWSYFDTTNKDEIEEQPWSGSLLRLPYNVDISDSNKSDVSLIEYIGRKHPVSYYGTQIGQSSTWSVVIEKDDVETLYALRRLSVWMGDVYIREPSGSGYWASISVSFSQKHCDLTIPVTIDVTRVEGGM